MISKTYWKYTNINIRDREPTSQPALIYKRKPSATLKNNSNNGQLEGILYRPQAKIRVPSFLVDAAWPDRRRTFHTAVDTRLADAGADFNASFKVGRSHTSFKVGGHWIGESHDAGGKNEKTEGFHGVRRDTDDVLK